MEVVPVDDAQDVPVKSSGSFGELGIRRYRLPEIPEGTYRLCFEDGSYEDVVAENASHAYQLGGRRDVARIINLPVAYASILDRDVIQTTPETVALSAQHLTPNFRDLLCESLEERSELPFEALDFQQLSQLRHKDT